MNLSPTVGLSTRLVSLSTVVTPAKNYDLTTLAVVKGLLQITGTSQDDYLKSLISAASAGAANYCNRVFPVETVLDEVFPSAGPFPYQLPGGVAPLQLSRYPVVSIDSVTVAGCDLVEGTDYRVDKANGHLIRLDANCYPCAWASAQISVQYDGGYATIPADLADAAARMARSRYFADSRDPMLRSENIEGVYEAQYWIALGNNGNMTPDITDLLDNYRTPVAA